MPLPSPQFDRRTYREMLNEALARIPTHNPEWTNFNDSDPGITLLQLFAFMTESIIYRTNLIPERNRMKFLRLLGISMRPASAATGFVAFANPKGTIEAKPLGANQELLAGDVPFRTQNGLTVLPIESKIYYKHPLIGAEHEQANQIYQRLYASFEKDHGRLSFYETRVFTTPESGVLLPTLKLGDTADASLWLALLRRNIDNGRTSDIRNEIAGKTLTLGLLPALSEDGCVLYPLGPSAASEQARLVFEMPEILPDNNKPRYKPIPIEARHDLLQRPGVVQLRLPQVDKLKTWDDLDPLEAGTGNYPPSLDETEDADRLITWIRIRSPEVVPGSDQPSQQLTVALSWVGINAAEVVQKSHVSTEVLPRGSGEPDQSVQLLNTPVIVDSVRLTVNGEIWQPVDDLNTADPEVPPRSPRLSAMAGNNEVLFAPGVLSAKVYSIDPESGEIRFGNGVHGARPPVGAVIQASYDYGGGLQGNIGIGSLKKAPTLPEGIKVNNPVPTWGADNAERVDEAERRIPAHIRHRDRLVSEKDFKEITQGTPGVDIGRVEVLPLFHPKLERQVSEGVVTVMVIPMTDPRQPNAPIPDPLFLETVCAQLEPRRILTTEVHVRGPEYVPVVVSIGVDVIPGRAEGPVLAEVKEAIENFLSPLKGGFERKGWPLGKPVEAVEIAAAATRVAGVASVNPPFYLSGEDANATDSILIVGLQLPRLTAISVVPGEAAALADVLGRSPESAGAGPADATPVPILPETC